MEKLESGNAVLQTIHSSEGGRALKLLQQRQKRHQELEKTKEEIESETKKRRLHKIDEKYQGSTTEALEESFRQQTVGLVSADAFREARRKLEELRHQQEKAIEEKESDIPTRLKKQKAATSKLSFQVEDEEEEEEAVGNEVKNEDSKSESENLEGDDSSLSSSCALPKKKYFGKDPTVNTSFLADVERDEKIRQEKEKLIKNYYEELEKEKHDMLEVTYSYWDGNGHRRSIHIEKGKTIGQFITECRKTLEKDFPELKSVSNENLLYVKEDLILPHHVTFHDLIRSRARGKSGPLFNFDVHEDVRMRTDVRIEKDESHAGKIVDRKWYEKNKHIFPASRWEAVSCTMPSMVIVFFTVRSKQDVREIHD
ncbi:protein FAM50A-like [Condylostylus longicornis]|uniref:protein FAM50A-like n=1 Tax=Condylostylus longicornis TaxID=2530218 RepID=UPI00244DEC9E|nr:protein FAM50A-like [Condylostylus longicornis]